MTFEEMKAELYKREEQAQTDKERYPDNEYLEGVFDGLHEAAKLVSVTDPAKHGRWIYVSVRDRLYKCELCGKHIKTNDIDAYEWCHGCGAKMDGGEE